MFLFLSYNYMNNFARFYSNIIVLCIKSYSQLCSDKV